ncbi:hypothetical protein LCGC14_2424180 [marine sediment metagenome]|uniref:Uncharacterized protein n=1 Tax=marine sediment metagenome TaxID=412755 RepID=A0A0F9EHY2_9ZZZZ
MAEKIECKICKFDKKKRRVIIRKPLEEIELNPSNGYREFYCSNRIKVFRRWNLNTDGLRESKWFEEECGNRLLVMGA